MTNQVKSVAEPPETIKTPIHFDGDRMRYIDADGEVESFYDIEAIVNDHATLLREHGEMLAALRHYADKNHWTHLGPDNKPGRHILLYVPSKGHGYDIAVKALAALTSGKDGDE